MADLKFSLHESEEDFAKSLKKELDEKKITWSQVEKEVLRILDGCTQEHIEKEIKESKKLLCFGEERT